MQKKLFAPAAYLLFGKNTQMRFSQAIVHAGAFKAEGAVIIDSHDARGNIQEQVDETLAFIRRNIRCAIVVTDKAPHDRYWEYPLDGLREALANAVCHRDYGMSNDIQVKVFENRVVIINPGQLPFDMSLADLENPDHPSRPRNKLIAQVFYDLHVIEHYGSGVRRIRNDCDKNGSPYPVWQSEHGECTIKFFARTKESIAKLGIDPEKFGVIVDGENGVMDTEKGIKAAGEVTEKTVQDTEKVTENNGENGVVLANSSPKQGAGDDAQVTEMLGKVTDNVTEIGETAKKIVRLVAGNPHITQEELARTLDISRPYVGRLMVELQTKKILRRNGADFGGMWEVL